MRVRIKACLILALILSPISRAAIGNYPHTLTPTFLTALRSRATLDTPQFHSFVADVETITVNQSIYTSAQQGWELALLYQILHGMVNGSGQSCDTNVCSNIDSGIAHTGNAYATTAVTITNRDVTAAIAVCSPTCGPSSPHPPYEGNAFRDDGEYVLLAWDWLCGFGTNCAANATFGFTSTMVTNWLTALTSSSQWFLHGHQFNPNNTHTAFNTAISQGTGPGSNQYAWWHTAANVGYVTFPDNPTASGGSDDEINTYNSDFNTNQQPYWNTGDGVGGNHLESPEYGPEAWFHALLSYEFVSLNSDPSNPWASNVPNFPVEVMNSILYSLSPGTSTRGAPVAQVEPWLHNDTQSPFYNVQHRVRESSLVALYAVPSNYKAYLKFALDNIIPSCAVISSSATDQRICRTFDMLFYDQNVTGTDYRSALPQDWSAKGTGVSFSFGSASQPSTPWADSNAIWSISTCEDENDIHRWEDPCDLTIYRKGQWLLLGGPQYKGGPSPIDSSMVNSDFEYYSTVNGGQLFKAGVGAKQQSLPVLDFFENSLKYTYTNSTLDGVYRTTGTCNSNNCSKVEPANSTGVFSGVGLNDMATSGNNTVAGDNSTVIVVIDSTGTPDTFKWNRNGGSFTTGVSLASCPCTLFSGTKISWTHTTGHTLNDQWTFSSLNFGDYTNPTNVSRDSIFLKPTATTANAYWAVIDRGNFRDSSQVRQNWMQKTNGSAPTISGNAVTSAVTGNILVVTGLLPASAAMTDVAVSTISPIYETSTGLIWAGSGFVSTWLSNGGFTPYRASWTSSVAAQKQVLLSVLQASDTGASAVGAEALTNANLACGHMQDPGDDKLMCFSQANPFAAITLPVTVSYTPASSGPTSTVVVTGLTPNTAVNVVATHGATWSYTIQTTAGGTAFTTSANGTLYFTDNGSALSPDTLAIITQTPLPVANTGASYSANLVAIGGKPAYNWTVTAGVLPSGVLLSGSGALSGTVASNATSQIFTAKAVDANSNPVSKTFALNVGGSLPASCAQTSSSPLPAGVITISYTFTFQAAGCTNPITWAVTAGSLPGGLSLAPSTGVLSGVPNATGTFTFTVRATDSESTPATPTLTFQLTINPQCSITSASPFSSAVATLPYTFTIQTANCVSPVTWTTTSGTLPSGFSLASGTGIISGTTSQTGTFTFTPQITDNVGSVASLSNAQITVVPAPPNPGGGSITATINATIK